ncbi:MAG TPA: sigma-70 family RNA polymerase sigma factor [Myxococcota bacterium]|nr:sigma-70 family RNA polymerase sigma factor [Myxococcota bacterium]
MKERPQKWAELEQTWRARMVAAQAGDRAAYEKLLLELLPYARHRAARSVRDHSAQEDVVQNVLISMHRARHTYRPERPFTAWFHAILRNAVIDWARSQARRAGREVSLDANPAFEPSIAAETPGGDALSAEMTQALAALPASQREAVELIHIDGLSVTDAAALAGVSAGALKVRAHRGYKALRGLLRERDTGARE